MANVRLVLFGLCAALGSVGCQQQAGFEAEAALRPGFTYTGPAVSTFGLPVQRLTLGQITKELTAMAEANRALDGVTDLAPVTSHRDRLNTIDGVHTARLGQIIDVIGWPTKELVGQDAALAAFLIAQAAEHDADFQKRCLALMHDRLAAGRLDPQRVAMLTDRVRVQAGLGQLYGTQVRLVTNEHGVMLARETAPIANPDELDQRRAQLGLDPWRHYCRKVADTAARAQLPGLPGR